MKIITYPNPILTQKTTDVPLEFLKTKEYAKLIKNIIHTMHRADGIGLAAPQVNIGLRLCVVAQKADPTLKSDLVLINPFIRARSITQEKANEECLSIPQKEYLVPRYTWVSLDAMTTTGETYECRAEGYFARVLQHEIDHLDGVLILDRGTEKGIL